MSKRFVLCFSLTPFINGHTGGTLLRGGGEAVLSGVLISMQIGPRGAWRHPRKVFWLRWNLQKIHQVC